VPGAFMRSLFRGLGWFLILIAVGIAAAEVVGFVRSGDRRLASIGEFWFAVDPAGINTTQAVIQRYLHPSIWDGLRPILVSVPALLLPLVLGVLFLVAARIGRPEDAGSGSSRRGRRRRGRNSLIN
jgi:hypothetical protein